MRYDYFCPKCGIIELEKRMSDPEFKKCPVCGSEVARHYGIPGILYADRPPWTYKEARKYKTAKWKGRETKIDPAKHGDIGSWNSPGELVSQNQS
jgi:putative FmdB family regulatory protein